jgi:hypothetical protein
MAHPSRLLDPIATSSLPTTVSASMAAMQQHGEHLVGVALVQTAVELHLAGRQQPTQQKYERNPRELTADTSCIAPPDDQLIARAAPLDA